MARAINRRCVVCGKNIFGTKPVGSHDIFYPYHDPKKMKKVGTAHKVPAGLGYAHIKCREATK